MEKTIKNKKSREASAGALSDFALKMLAIVIAVIIWFALSITKFPTYTKTVMKVPVDFSMTGTSAEAKGLSAMNYEDMTVDVEIEGMNYEIGTYTANDLVATVNTDDVIKADTYKLAIDVRSAHSNDQCKILSVKPETVEIKFEHRDTVTRYITISSPNVSAEEGYTLKEYSVQPKTIEISGSEDALDMVSKVEVVYSDSLKLSEDKTVTSNKLLLYDENNNLLNSADYEIEDTVFNITYSIYKKVTGNLSPQFTDVPPGFDIDSLPMKLSQDSIQLITPQPDAAAEEDMKLDSVSLYDISQGKTFKTRIDKLLSVGEINQSGTDYIEMSFDLDDYEVKEFTIPAKNVQFINAPMNRSAVLDTEQITGVKLIGPKDIISKIKLKNIKAVIDLSDISAAGSVSHQVVIYCPDHNMVWNIGTHEAMITVNENNISEFTRPDSSTQSIDGAIQFTTSAAD